MPLSALALVVLAGFIHACWNIAAKKAGGDVRFVAFTSVVLMVFWAPVGLWVGWQQVPSWGLLEWALVLAGGLLHIVYFIVLLRGYRKADLTVVYPLARGSGPLLSSMVAIVFLGDGVVIATSFKNVLDDFPGEGVAIVTSVSVTVGTNFTLPGDLVLETFGSFTFFGALGGFPSSSFTTGGAFFVSLLVI